ncbi:MAG: dCTP deaminase [Candidatus Bipolaricaulia bacterium]
MMLLNDRWIREQAERGMISPFVPEQVREGVISYGLSSYGYDIRVADEFKVFNPANAKIIDPKRFDPRSLLDFKGESCIIPANSFALARSVEYLRIPRDVLAICLGKSTLARCGIIVNITPLEPEWEGYITIEISNTSPIPARIYSGEGIAQVIFLRAEEPCLVSYADRQGKYQGQGRGIWLPRV